MRLVGFYRDMEPGNPGIYREDILLNEHGELDYPTTPVIQYLTSAYPILDIMESTADVIGGKFRVPGGSSILTDGTFIWRADLESYVHHYPIVLPEDFVKHMKRHHFKVPHSDQSHLLNLSTSMTDMLNFRIDPGAGPQR